MSSLVELKDACTKKATELVDAIESSDTGDAHQLSHAVENLTRAACMADNQAQADTWGKQSQGVEVNG